MVLKSRAFLLYPLLLAAFILGLFLSPAYADAADITEEVGQIIRENYVEKVPAGVLSSSTVEGMLKKLGDPHAQHMTREEYQEQKDALDSSFTGVGIYVAEHTEGIEVIAVIKGTPADKAGIARRDVILSIDGKSLAGLSLDEAIGFISGPVGSKLRMEVKRDEKSIFMDIIRANIEVPTVNAELLEGGVAYIVIHDFGRRTSGELGKVIRELDEQKPSGWIIDLRGNPGGYLNTAMDLAGYFVADAPVVLMEDRSITSMGVGVAQTEVIRGPVVVLTDEHSASAAEILAAALQDNQRALLIGKKTYGKGSIQEIFPLSDGGVFKLTVAYFYSPAGHDINGVGVSPDIEVEDDNIIAAAELILSEIRDNSASIISLDFDGLILEMDAAVVRRTANWQTWADIVAGTGGVSVYYGNDPGWIKLSAEEMEQKWPLYYPGYEYRGELAAGAISVDMGAVLNERYVNDFNIELINSINGQRVECTLELTGVSTIECRPLKPLESGEYWLVIHDTLRLADGERMPQGQIGVIKQ